MSKRYIHIGSWNIEHFSKQGGRKENIYALTEHIEMASLDIIALQEIYVTHSGPHGLRRNEHLDGVVELLKEHTDNEWLYDILENRSSDDKEQLCAIFWNTKTVTRVDSIKIPVQTNVDGQRLWDRSPHAVKFRHEDKTDFVIIPLHMKANVGGATAARKIRHLEAQTLVENLPLVREKLSDLDVIMLGDTNCLSSSEPALRLITDNGYEDLNEADAGTFISGAPFDRIFLPMNRKAFAYSRQYIMVSANPDDHNKYLSDHYLVKTVLKVGRDED